VWPRIRPFEKRDAAAVVELSLRAWEPVFVSLEQVLGPDVFGRLHPDWREDQRQAVEEVCSSQETRVWVADKNGEIVGFVATGVFDRERRVGEISMLAVDPDHQAGGVGTALTEFALDSLRDAGMRIAMVETGGDPGHAPARRTYERAGFTLLPIARYFQNL
jgi:ribosomal protein S18 acetylase RimI-like enzyme